MHIGSVSSQMAGSLWFGGYDQNRLIGDVLVADEDFVRSPITLKDIAIDVIQGASPFDFTAKSGLLAAGNTSIANGLPVAVDGCSPYLTLPRSTCDNIAANLPVTFNANLGLYIWDTESTKYRQIVSSASALSFTLLSDSNTKTTTVRVPFYHLNLTLSEPLADSPMQYFPCFTGGPGTYNLGRAFLQDAFLGANWGQSKWWLGQAPGPNIQLSPSVIEITEDDVSIKNGSNDWERSWEGAWKALTEDEANGTTTVEPPAQSGVSSNDGQKEDSAVLSTGAKVGIGLGCSVAALAGLGALVFFYYRRRKARAVILDQTVMAEYQKGPAEMHGSSPSDMTPMSELESRPVPKQASHDPVELP
ncbi:hypothetical protein CGCF415_v001263 [Colletotrichum fructicola]|nr:hypothetical protein CGCF415_v001263 [Colletotrichum fructicola]KAF4942761.1 hypothetical protein CGCF245_v000109 [Colletotrichum fructicola]KAF5499195.1 hypothetical protein CGCF413_v006810 [Colletotrichum fructicola]